MAAAAAANDCGLRLRSGVFPSEKARDDAGRGGKRRTDGGFSASCGDASLNARRGGGLKGAGEAGMGRTERAASVEALDAAAETDPSELAVCADAGCFCNFDPPRRMSFARPAGIACRRPARPARLGASNSDEIDELRRRRVPGVEVEERNSVLGKHEKKDDSSGSSRSEWLAALVDCDWAADAW